MIRQGDEVAARVASLLLLCLGIGTATGASAAALDVGWGAATTLAPLSQQTFAPELAVNRAGGIVTAWFAGPGPPVSFGAPVRAVRRWSGNEVVADLGTITNGFRQAVVLARNGDDQGDDLKVALSGSGVAFVVWRPVRRSSWVVATAQHGRFTVPRRLALGSNVRLARLAFGLEGPVDVLSFRLGKTGATGWACTPLRANGSLGQMIPAAHPYRRNPCGLPATKAISRGATSLRPSAPAGWRVQTLLVGSDGQGNAAAIWDDMPSSGGYTHGIFTAVRHS